MNKEVFRVGEKVKMYFPQGIIKGEVVGSGEVSIEDSAGKYFYTTTLYLVVSQAEKIHACLEPFMTRDKGAR